MHKRIYLSPPHMGGQEIDFVNEAFSTNWISPVGPNISAFENDLADYAGVPFVAALSSGTAAIHLALILLGVEPGDEVLCSSFTFAGSCNPIMYQQAKPIFIDSEEESWNIDPVLLERAIEDRLCKGKKPKALILVHLYGTPAKLEEILEITSKYKIPIIEDAAEALGSTYKGRRLGSFGDFGVFSFNGNKIITTSGGGALLSSNKSLIDRAKFLATQARDNAPHYEHTQIGYNYRLSNISAGIGRGQMLNLPKFITFRRRNYDRYKEALSNIVGVMFPDEPEHCFSNRWLTTILIDPELTGGIDREDVRMALEAKNIETRPLWKPMHMQPVYKEALVYANGTSERLFELGLCLPSGSNLKDSEQNEIIHAIKEVLRVTS
ncbi:aminotransferase class I/II-fold pyridoxal phosphate-dependent enzyme [Fulvivirga kasyanovii]|uniref:Aminotransferase class I/II-fold pyridoxal phosphate-dependent enzyme n=1 Tax=Fulvivirga kasyanovii TaxID=396812 RepID=A0ABW9RKV7_9BACT|nr:aminotransferase class I/II-fold pyridoxal phosphate-dependent enzyme [Fulvivirga kasyanovii]MTI24658.1 aminotransferase class I/II-fold pyridoxal phosphate-dependent enzyme [Fulvivirga kasyanovii]